MADGSQLRRRVRMATADEPVDTDAIANQAANELRTQIEASPIGERLDRVVQEDRPLASRAISAETPLVDEPDDSPSAREVSFHLAAPTGRGAVRSALRTPGLAADLRPSSPFGEEETGIAPEPEAVAKPEAADVDILEPEQPDRSPAGPDRDATAQGESTDELQELHKAQQHDRRARIGAGVLRGVQALASMIGGAANIPGLSALGGLANVTAGVIPQGAGVADFEQRHGLAKEAAQARQRADQQAYERAQDAEQAKRAERQLAVNVSNAEAGQVNARASREMQNRLNETRLAEYAAENDPAHPDAENARGVFSSFLDAAAREKPELREDFADIVERLPSMSASQIRGAIDQLKIFRNAPAGARRSRGGRGPGGPPRANTDWAQPLADPALELIAQTTASRSNGQVPIEAARAAASRSNDNTAATTVFGIGGLGNQNAEARAPDTQPGSERIDEARYAAWEPRRTKVFNAELAIRAAVRAYNSAPDAVRRAALSDDVPHNLAQPVAELRAVLRRQATRYLSEISGQGVSEGEYARTIANTGANNAIQPSVLNGFLTEELNRVVQQRNGMATQFDGAFERAYRTRMASQMGGR